MIGWWERRERRRTREAVHKALDRAYDEAGQLDFDAESDRLVILSDQHKGAGDGADDFQRCERAYNAALAYYNHLQYRLVVLGDVEELWENSFDEVAARYPRALALEAVFHSDGRYTRLWGNHDLAWTDKLLFQKRMAAHGVGDVTPIEAVRLSVGLAERGKTDELFLVHGHQGTADSDRHARRSRFLVRHGWRWLQRRIDHPWNTPAVDWALRGEHAHDMACWAASRRRVVVAGHTHLPVFYDQRKQPAITPEEVASPEDEADPKTKEALKLARLEWAAAEEKRLLLQQPINLDTPCYFNTGCCSFGDGDITGIEIGEGAIRLVRWPCEPDVAPEELACMRLADVFALAG